MALAPDGSSLAPPTEPGARAVDVVAVLRADTGAQVFAEARPMRATVYQTAELMEHPLEDGSVTTDHKVQRPTEIDLPIFLRAGPDLKALFAEIRQLWHDGTLLIVQTSAATYGSMLLTDIPHEEHPDALFSATVSLRLREARFVQAVYSGLPRTQVAAPAQASTVRRGAQQTTPATAPQTAAAASATRGSTLYRLTRGS